MTDSLIEMYDRGFERDSIVWIAITRENWLKISDRVTQIRQELSLAEEGLANYAQEVERLKAAQLHMYGEGKRFEGLWRDAAQALERIQQERLTWAMYCECTCKFCERLSSVIRLSVPQPAPQSES